MEGSGIRYRRFFMRPLPRPLEKVGVYGDSIVVDFPPRFFPLVPRRAMCPSVL